MRVNTLLPSSGSSRRKPRATRDSTRVARSIAAAQWDQYPAGEYKPHNPPTVSLLSAPLLIPDPVALSCRTRRVIYDRRMDRSGPTDGTSIHVLMPVRYGHNDGNVFILPTLRHDDRSTN
ncbi:hypothetical protein ALC57_03422 [Trachymyrmex cornetzi]|uniref:Uncharacterized protein n=1 Tax=Trachymyrmex cornetzi TaxID=471704 RepID=A0A195EFN2_9HYME|nr:hypothetical protein ALC57_03422 [Trachymyrmex cornetzi]